MTNLLPARTAVSQPVCRALAVLLLAGAGFAGAASATTYRVVELPLPPFVDYAQPNAINATGEIVGYAPRRGDIYDHAIAWSGPPDYTPRWLSGGRNGSRATAINDAGVIVGTANIGGSSDSHAVMWGQGGRMLRLDDGLPGAQYSGVYDINAGGTALGFIYDGSSGPPVFWFGPAARYVLRYGSSVFRAVMLPALNDSGTAVGSASLYADDLEDWYPIRFAPGAGTQLLDVLPGDHHYSEVLDVNEAGQAVGYIDNRSYVNERAVLWNADGSVLDLGELPGGSEYSYQARHINNAGEVVGRYNPDGGFIFGLFVWNTATGMQDIKDLVDPEDPWYPLLQSGDVEIHSYGINDAGVIPCLFDGVTVVLVPQA